LATRAEPFLRSRQGNRSGAKGSCKISGCSRPNGRIPPHSCSNTGNGEAAWSFLDRRKELHRGAAEKGASSRINERNRRHRRLHGNSRFRRRRRAQTSVSASKGNRHLLRRMGCFGEARHGG